MSEFKSEIERLAGNSTHAEIIFVTRIKLANLTPYNTTDSRFEGERLINFANSIKNQGLQEPIIVRSLDDGKYQIISGHNRVNATRLLGLDEIDAIVKKLSDDKAKEVYFESNINQQSFKDWSFSQRLKAVNYMDKLVKENSQQGKRNDLASDETYVQNGQKSHKQQKGQTTRDKMSTRLGIPTATFSKYRNIVKLDTETVDEISKLLDNKVLSLDNAYRLSQLDTYQIEFLLNWLKNNPVKCKGYQGNQAFKKLFNLKKERKLTQDLIVEELEKLPLNDDVVSIRP